MQAPSQQPRPKVEVVTKVPLTEAISTTKVCGVCYYFCKELKTLVRPGFAAEYFRRHRKLPQVKLWCPNGCHRNPRWGFMDVTDKRLKGKHINGRGLA